VGCGVCSPERDLRPVGLLAPGPFYSPQKDPILADAPPAARARPVFRRADVPTGSRLRRVRQLDVCYGRKSPFSAPRLRREKGMERGALSRRAFFLF
jgi:hypothetical protein